jgi:hypothetical protein
MKAHRSLFRCALTLSALVLVAGCHEGDAIVDPPLRSPTPTPVPTVQLAGAWTGHFGDAGAAFTATVGQSGSGVTIDWTSSTYGAIRFTGTVSRGQIRGRLSAERDSARCPIGQPELTGTATASHIGLSGTGLCRSFDPFRVTIELTR